MANVYSVTQINSYIKNMFQQDYVLNKVNVRGEISNFKRHSSGHLYFTLKDQSGTISIVMFASQASKLTFQMREGQKVIVSGRIDVYERDGKYQLYANELTLDGAGDLYKKFEELKNKLEEMGMFSSEYKRKIPMFAKKVGIVTASTGAAIQDIIHISKRRNPYVQLILYPALVQGELAKYSIVKGIQALDKMNVDVIIIGRGGGSIEDLWAFNEEIVANAIFRCQTPIISAVGHETDFTISDFVSDLRAPTPSAAAELAIADINLIEERLLSYQRHLFQSMNRVIQLKKNQIEKYFLKLNFLNPVNQLNEKRMSLLRYEEQLKHVFSTTINHKKYELMIYSERLNGLSPLQKLSQGYAYLENEEGQSVRSINSIEENQMIKVHITDGTIEARILHKNKIDRMNKQ